MSSFSSWWEIRSDSISSQISKSARSCSFKSSLFSTSSLTTTLGSNWSAELLFWSSPMTFICSISLDPLFRFKSLFLTSSWMTNESDSSLFKCWKMLKWSKSVSSLYSWLWWIRSIVFSSKLSWFKSRSLKVTCFWLFLLLLLLLLFLLLLLMRFFFIFYINVACILWSVCKYYPSTFRIVQAFQGLETFHTIVTCKMRPSSKVSTFVVLALWCLYL